MRTLINRIYSEVNGITVILATLPQIRDAASEPYVEQANAGYKALAKDLAEEGRKIELVDMYTTWLGQEDYSDSIHFTHSGYAKIAALFAKGFSRVEAKGWLSAPLRTDFPGSAGCYPNPTNFRGPIRTQQGSGHNDGGFILSSAFERSKDLPYKQQVPETGSGYFHFANVVQLANENSPRDELIRVLDPSSQKTEDLPSISYHANLGDATFNKAPTPLAVGQECLKQNVRWADIDGDGIDDFVCIESDGIPHVSLNRAGVPPNFEFIGAIRDEKTLSKVHLADIDGDGRADFCQVEAHGIRCWRNGGVGDAPISKYNGSWENTLQGSNGLTLDLDSSFDPAGIHLIDINGDGRADWIYLSNNTIADVRINQRGDRGDGPGLKPHWRDNSNQIEGWPIGDKITGDKVLLARVFGSGRNDIIHVEQADDQAYPVFHFYRNTGRGGAYLRGDGVRYCDMYGRGYDDYLWIGPDGTIELFENTQNASHWHIHGQILNTTRPGKLVHVGDWDGDALCDILAVDHTTGNVDLWRNAYKQGNAKPTFEASRRVVNNALCPQPFIIGDMRDLAVRFGDLDGDKRVDYICLDLNGRSTARLNTPSGLTDPKQIKSSEAVPRSSILFADVNGDGAADYLVINAFTGAVRVWINLGIVPNSPDSIAWDSQPDIWMQGMERGGNVHFLKLSTLGRADYHVVYPQTSVADTWFNEGACVGGGADDDGKILDPKLPVPPV